MRAIQSSLLIIFSSAIFFASCATAPKRDVPQSIDDLVVKAQVNADTYTKDMLLLAAIANQEGVTVDEAGARQYLEEQYAASKDYFSMMGITSSEDYASMADIREVQESILMDSVVDLLQEKIKIVEVEPAEEDLEALPDEDFEMGTEDLNEYEEETEEGPNPEDLEPLEEIEDGEASD